MSPLRRLRWPVIILAGALTLGACGGGDDDAEPADAGSSDAGAAGAVTIERFTFQPEAIEIPAGTAVTWTNTDSVTHSIEDEGGLFPEGEEIPQDGEFSHTYEAPGDYPYVCGIHPYMTGTVSVT